MSIPRKFRFIFSLHFIWELLQWFRQKILWMLHLHFLNYFGSSSWEFHVKNPWKIFHQLPFSEILSANSVGNFFGNSFTIFAVVHFDLVFRQNFPRNSVGSFLVNFNENVFKKSYRNSLVSSFRFSYFINMINNFEIFSQIILKIPLNLS